MDRRGHLLQAFGFLALGLGLIAHQVTGPTATCPRAPLTRGGDEVPGFCVSYDDALGWPLLAAGLASLLVGLGILWWLAGARTLATLLRASLLLLILGSAIVLHAWNGGPITRCVTTEGAAATCYDSTPPWVPPTYALGGVLLGAASAAGGLLLSISRAPPEREGHAQDCEPYRSLRHARARRPSRARTERDTERSTRAPARDRATTQRPTRKTGMVLAHAQREADPWAPNRAPRRRTTP